MKFYALVLWRHARCRARALQLVYLGNSEIVRYEPDEQDLLATERKVKALWAAIERAARTGDWRPSPSRLCDWCDHRALCPAFGGTPPPAARGRRRAGLRPGGRIGARDAGPRRDLDAREAGFSSRTA